MTEALGTKLLAYVRVSTDLQAEQGLGLQVQERAIRTWAQTRGFKVVDVHKDEGVSGSLDVAQRPGLASCLNLLQHGAAQGLIVARLDRLARALTVQEAVLARVWEAGGSVFTVDAGEIHRDDPADPMRTAMRQMVGVFAQLERGMIVARMRAGRVLKAAKGEYAYGAPPLGYRSENRSLIRVEEEWATVERIRALRDEGCSLRQIADRLDAEGHHPKRAVRWHPQTLSQVLKRLDAR